MLYARKWKLIKRNFLMYLNDEWFDWLQALYKSNKFFDSYVWSHIIRVMYSILNQAKRMMRYTRYNTVYRLRHTAIFENQFTWQRFFLIVSFSFLPFSFFRRLCSSKAMKFYSNTWFLVTTMIICSQMRCKANHPIETIFLKCHFQFMS